MAKKFNHITRLVPARPRSERLRQMGVTSVAGSITSVVGLESANTNTSGSGSVGHTHSNKIDLDKLGVEDGYVMIDEGEESTKAKAGEADRAAFADEAKDITPESNAYGHFLRKDVPDTAAGRIDFAAGFDAHSATIRQALSSPGFVPGMDGEGWRLALDSAGLGELEVDKLTVRQTMRIFELIVQKIRAVGGQLIVSAASAKVAHVENDHSDGEEDGWISGTDFRVYTEGANQFVVGDLVRCQLFSGADLRSYWLRVVNSTPEYFVVSIPDAAEGEADSLIPKEGDEVVLLGNTSDPARQNAILISATDDGRPCIDVLSGIHSTTLAGCLRTRLGCLEGIAGELQPHGYGLYSDNAYLKGKFVLQSGEDVGAALSTKVNTDDYATLFAVAANLAGFAVHELNADGTLKAGSSIMTTAQGNKLLSYNQETGQLSSIEQSPSTIRIKATQLDINGAVSANGSFTIDEVGNMTCTSGTFGGYLRTNLVPLNNATASRLDVPDVKEHEVWILDRGHLNVYAELGQTVMLPYRNDMIGTRVIVSNPLFASHASFEDYADIVVADGNRIYGAVPGETRFGAYRLRLQGHTVELVCIDRLCGQGLDGTIEPAWVVMGGGFMTCE